LSTSRPPSGLPMAVFGVTGCVAARLRACSSRRSTLKSSARIGSGVFQGDIEGACVKARRMSGINWTFLRLMGQFNPPALTERRNCLPAK
jgi:hypothetical protein